MSSEQATQPDNWPEGQVLTLTAVSLSPSMPLLGNCGSALSWAPEISLRHISKCPPGGSQVPSSTGGGVKIKS